MIDGATGLLAAGRSANSFAASTLRILADRNRGERVQIEGPRLVAQRLVGDGWLKFTAPLSNCGCFRIRKICG